MKASTIRRASIACFLWLVCSLHVRAGQTRTAQRCGVDQDQAPMGVYADFDGKGWRQYQNAKSIPELELNVGAAAFLWSGSNGNQLVSLQEPGEDFAAYSDYCFDKSGKIIQLRYELRTAWGWGFRQEGAFTKNSFRPETGEFFDTVTGQRIERPDQANDIQDALKPRVYRTTSQLPFSKLLSKGMV
jgi:hypothetical protein